MIIMSMRDKIKSRAGKSLMIFIFIGLFGGLGISKFIIDRFVDSDSIVIVNKIPVSIQTYTTKLKQEEEKIASYKTKYGKSAETVMKIMGMSTDPQLIALRTVTYNALLESFSKKMGLHLSPDYVMVKLNDPYFLMQTLRQYFPAEEIQNPVAIYQMLKNTPHFAQIDQQMQLDMKNDVLFSTLRSGLYIPSFVMDHAHKHEKASKKFGVQKFSLPFFVEQAKKTAATQEQLKAFFDEQNILSKRYWLPEKRAATQWTFNPKEYGITVTEQEITDFYAKNKTTRFIDTKAQVKVRELVIKADKKNLELGVQEARRLQEEALKDPASFVALIKKHSTKKESKDKDGVVDFFSKSSENATEFEKAAFRLKEDGEISPVIKLDDSFVILQRVARKDATYKTLAKAKDEIIRLLMDQKFKSVFAKDVSSVVHGTDAQSLDAFVAKHNGHKTEKALQVRSENPNLVEQKMFGIRKDNGVVAFIDEGKGVLLKLTTLDRSQSATLKAVKDQVAQDYYEQEGLKLMEKALQKAKKTAATTKKLAPAEGSTISTTDWLNPTDTKKISELSSAQGYPQGFMAIDWIGGTLFALGKSGGVLVALEGIQELKNATSEDKKQVATAVYRDQNRLYSQGFIASLYRDATIKINEDLARTIERQQ